jgi:NAD(P)-dependent dehydrogenase (short-subunit alcohol dehydrogenase family)
MLVQLAIYVGRPIVQESFAQSRPSTVLVVGGSSGIGAAVVSLLRDRHHIVNIDRSASSEVATVDLDLGNIDRLADRLAGLPGSIDSIVYCAGLPGTRRAAEVLAVNAVAPSLLLRALRPRLNAGGAIVLTGSVSTSSAGSAPEDLDELLSAGSRAAVEAWTSARSLSSSVAYEVSKAAIDRLTETLCEELLDDEIRVNCVKPGPIQTDLLPEFRESMGPKRIDRASRLVGRHGTPTDVATVIQFLLSPGSAWVNGALIPVDGGLMSILRKRHASR